MAPLPPVPKTIQFQLVYTDGTNTNVRNMLYFTYTGTVSPTDLVTLCNNLKTEWNTYMAPQTNTSVHLLNVYGNDLASPTGAQGVDSNVAYPGTMAGAALTSGCALCISHETGLKYKGGHSRVYLPGQTQINLLDANTWTTAFQSAILTAWTSFISHFLSTLVPAAVGSLQQVVAHRYGRTPSGPGGPPDSDLPSVPLTSPYTTPVTAYRSRRSGSRRHGTADADRRRRRNQQRF